MFIRVTATPNSPRKSVKVVASIREGLKVKQKMIHHVGIASDESEIEKLKRIGYEFIARSKRDAESKSNQQKFFSNTIEEDIAAMERFAFDKKLGRKAKTTLREIIPVNQVTLDQIIEEHRVIEGVHEVAGYVYNELGYNSILSQKKDQELLRDLVLTRLVQPASKHKSQNILNDKFAKVHDLDRIYRLLDKLHEKIDLVKLSVFERTRTLMPEKTDIVFFDVTTLYFESVEVDSLRDFGYSKDMRFNTTQVVLALATNSDGLPIGYELFNGKTAEVKTLLAALDIWQQKFDIGAVCFVGDRAMMSEDNLKELEASGCTYVIAAKLRGLSKSLQQEILDPSLYKATVLNDDIAWVSEFNYNERRLIVSHKSKRAEHDAYKREQALTKIRKRIGEKGDTKKLITNQGVRKYTTTKGSETTVDENKIDKDEIWDGFHGVITNLKDPNKTNIIKRYSRLWVIEESFRLNKHNLAMRPIYHFKPERIEAHIALCYMAFSLLRHLQYKVNITTKISVNSVIEELMKIQASIYVHKQTGDKYKVPGHFTHNAAKIYKTFNLTRNLDAMPIMN